MKIMQKLYASFIEIFDIFAFTQQKVPSEQLKRVLSTHYIHQILKLADFDMKITNFEIKRQPIYVTFHVSGCIHQTQPI